MYPSCFTDTEWALVADLFESQGGRGAAPRPSRRTLLEACCYVVVTGCSWRMLPRDFPHRDNVYKTFRRLSAQGKFEQMHDRLRAHGVSGKSALTARQQRSWIHSRPAVLRKAVTAVTTQPKSEGA